MTRPLALIIEDNKEVAEVFGTILEMEAYEVAIVRSGETAVKYLADHTPALVILDMYLPDASGEELLLKIRRDARLVKTRVVIVTAFPQTTRFMAAKADTVLCKPLRLEQIRHIAARFYPTDRETPPEDVFLSSS
ncbi:MAG: response regulator [Anaerolineales bacterium]|nr:response regulator [Anaerolineales bacterium]